MECIKPVVTEGGDFGCTKRLTRLRRLRASWWLGKALFIFGKDVGHVDPVMAHFERSLGCIMFTGVGG